VGELSRCIQKNRCLIPKANPNPKHRPFTRWRIHGYSSGILQTLNYAYNIRSWLTNINDVSGFSDDIVEMTKKKTLNLQDDKNIGWHIKTQRFGTLNDGGSDMGQHCKKR